MKPTEISQLTDFYQAFSAACFALLALWLVVVQIRIEEWQQDPVRQRRAYGVALFFALPGMMGMLALVDTSTPTFWRASFEIVAFSGALILVAVRGFPVPVERGRSGFRGFPVADRLSLAAYVAAIGLYISIGALAISRGLRADAVLLTILVFLGFNVAWLLLFGDRPTSPVAPSGHMG